MPLTPPSGRVYTLTYRLRAPIRSRACFYLTSCRLPDAKRAFELPIRPGPILPTLELDTGPAVLAVRHTVGRTFLAPWNRSSRIAVVAFS